VLSLVAVGAMYMAARRATSPEWAVLAAAALAFLSTALEYFRSFKQYGGEVAAVALVLWATVSYLRAPGQRQFACLLAAVAITMTLAYPVAFAAPGIVLAVAFAGSPMRAGVLAGAAAAELAILYWFVIAPNVSPALWTYWEASYADAYGPSVWAVMLFALGVAVHLALRLLRGARGWIEWTQLVCLLPCVLLLAAELAGWYPASDRTRLFIRPCLLLLAVTSFDRLVPARALPVAAVLVALGGVYTQIQIRAAEPFEDYAALIAHLGPRIEPGDRLLVHASAREGFRLYAAMAGWNAPAIYGDTGWPCCRRAGNAPPHSATPQAVFDDLAAKVPAGFAGRLWLVYTTRPLHWAYVGLDEGNLWRSHMWARGCPPEPYVALPNLAISPMRCGLANSP
jgi:hypothetical protein